MAVITTAGATTAGCAATEAETTIRVRPITSRHCGKEIRPISAATISLSVATVALAATATFRDRMTATAVRIPFATAPARATATSEVRWRVTTRPATAGSLFSETVRQERPLRRVVEFTTLPTREITAVRRTTTIMAVTARLDCSNPRNLNLFQAERPHKSLLLSSWPGRGYPRGSRRVHQETV